MQQDQRFKITVLVVVPLLITWWCVSDGGLRNGLNRVVYEIIMGVFFAANTLVLGLDEWISRARKRPKPGNFRLMLISAAAFLAWVIAAALFENLP